MTTMQFTTMHDALGAHKIYAMLSSYPVQALRHRQQILKFFVSDTQDAVIVTADGVPLTITMHDGTITPTIDKTRARGLWCWRLATGATPLPATG